MHPSKPSYPSQTLGCHTTGGVRRIDPFASQNLHQPRNPKQKRGLPTHKKYTQLSDFASQLPQLRPPFLGSLRLRVLNRFGGTTNGQAVPRGKPWDRQPVSGKLRRKLVSVPGLRRISGQLAPKRLSTRSLSEPRKGGRSWGSCDAKSES